MKYSISKEGLTVFFTQCADDGSSPETIKGRSVEANLLFEVINGLQSLDKNVDEIKKKINVQAAIQGGLAMIKKGSKLPPLPGTSKKAKTE